MSEILEDQPPTQTFAERVATAKNKSRKNAAQEQMKQEQPKLVGLSDTERTYAKQMLPLIQNESFKKWCEFINVKIVERLGNVFRRPPDAMFDSKNDDRGEWLSFNQGVITGMQMVRDLPNKLFEFYLQEQSQEVLKKEPQK